MPTRAAQNRRFIELLARPNFRGMAGELGMTGMARKPSPAAFEANGNDVAFAVIMRAARLIIQFETGDFDAVQVSLHPSDFCMHGTVVWRRPPLRARLE
jgi:hypothetical protein